MKYPKQYIINKELHQTVKDFNCLLSRSKTLKGKLTNKASFNLKSTEEFLLGSWIEKEYFTLVGTLIAASAQQTKVNYKIRTNQSLIIFNIMGLLMTLPTFAIMIWAERFGEEKNLNVSEHNFEIGIAFLFCLILWFAFFYFWSFSLRRKGKKVFDAFLNELKDLDSNELKS